jgi:hypothetical protein
MTLCNYCNLRDSTALQILRIDFRPSTMPPSSGERSGQMIDGLKLTMTGDEVRRLLQERADEHREAAARWEHEANRPAEDQTEDTLQLPAHMCESEAGHHEWRAEVLEFLREHLEPQAIYRLGEADLAFGELLPGKPGWLEQTEDEARTRVGFGLEQFARRVCSSPEIIQVTNPDARLYRPRGEDD